MTCDVEHTMVKSKALSSPSNPLQILGVTQAIKTNLALKKTYLCKLDLTRLKHTPGNGIGLSVLEKKRVSLAGTAAPSAHTLCTALVPLPPIFFLDSNSPC